MRKRLKGGNTMPNTTAPLWRTILSWALRLLVAAAFLAAAGLKLSGNPHMVEEFGKIGLGQGFRLATGIIEGTGALLLLWPRAVMTGVLILIGVDAGALAAQLGPLHGDVVHVFVLGALLVVIGALRLSAPKA
jgi:hypothetical protein